MQNSSCHAPERLITLLSQLTQAQQNLRESIPVLTDSMDLLEQNLDWVEGRILLLDESQHRLSGPEMSLTKDIEESGPDLLASLMMQRSHLNRQVRAWGDSVRDWLKRSRL